MESGTLVVNAYRANNYSPPLQNSAEQPDYGLKLPLNVFLNSIKSGSDTFCT
jgi:hypothetical protein